MRPPPSVLSNVSQVADQRYDHDERDNAEDDAGDGGEIRSIRLGHAPSIPAKANPPCAQRFQLGCQFRGHLDPSSRGIPQVRPRKPCIPVCAGRFFPGIPGLLSAGELGSIAPNPIQVCAYSKCRSLRWTSLAIAYSDDLREQTLRSHPFRRESIEWSPCPARFVTSMNFPPQDDAVKERSEHDHWRGEREEYDDWRYFSIAFSAGLERSGRCYRRPE